MIKRNNYFGSFSDFPENAWNCQDEVNTSITNGGTYMSIYTNYFILNCSYNKIFPKSDLVLYENVNSTMIEIQRESQHNATVIENRFSLLISIER